MGMVESATATTLRRKAEHGRATQTDARGQPVPGRALQDAFRRAAEQELELAVLANDPRERHGSSIEIVEELPDMAFLGILLGPDDGVGLFCLDSNSVAAIVEMRTMGTVSKREVAPRRTTRADAAMVADVIDRVLAEFEAPLLEGDDARWTSGWRYQLFLADPRPLPIVLEEGTYRILETELVFGDGAKEGKAIIALPATGRARPRAPAPPPEHSSAGRKAKEWSRTLEQAVGLAEAQLDIVLGRVRLTLGDLSGLAEGDRILLPMTSLGRVSVVARGGEPVAQGRLGQTGGVRAVKVAASDHAAAASVAEGFILPAGTFQTSHSPNMADASLDEFAPAMDRAGSGAPGFDAQAPITPEDLPSLGGLGPMEEAGAMAEVQWPQGDADGFPDLHGLGSDEDGALAAPPFDLSGLP